MPMPSVHLARITRLLSAVALTAACAESPRALTSPQRDSAPSHDATATAVWSQVVDGQQGDGSTYRMYLPTSWNGKLVVYAHGVVYPFLPLALPAEGDSIAAIFGEDGYAVALSSYSETGIALKDGVQRTHQLRGLFVTRFAEPARTYLAGRSMGGFIVTALAERYPEQYDGVMPFCGVVGGFPAEMAYIFNARLLFDYFFPGALPGSIDSVPMPSDPAGGLATVAALQSAAVQALFTDARMPPASVMIALVDQTRMPLPNTLGGPLTSQQFAKFIVTPILLHGILIDDILQQTHGAMPIGNVGTTYTATGVPWMAGPLMQLNANIERIATAPDAVEWLEHNGNTSGELTIPMLSLHTRYDTQVPLMTEAVYAAKVAAAGHSDLLVQRTTEGFDHCNFSPAELEKGMSDLSTWAESGVKPIP